jgi:hypothetical protein
VKRLPSLALQALLAGLIVMAAGCKFPPRPMKFNNMIARGNARLSDAAKKFSKAVTPLKENKAADTRGAEGAYSEMQTALNELKKEAEETGAPVSSSPGTEMLEKYRAFLQAEQAIFDSYVTPAWKAVQDPRLANPAQKWFKIGPLLAKAAEDEAGPLNALKTAQKEYCKHYNFEAKLK